jgi:hypothetical protein
MPRGIDSFSKHTVAVAQRKEAAQAQFGPKADYFGLTSGQIAVVRFLEQGTDIAWAATHRIPIQGRAYPQEVICLDQEDDGTPCPMCQSEHKGIRARSTKGFYNLIWRGGAQIQGVNAQIMAQNQERLATGQQPYLTYTLAPVYKRNEFDSPEKGPDGNKIVLGFADGLFLWKASKSVHDQIVSKDGTYSGICSRDFTIRRQGSTKDDTAYFIEPYDVNGGPQPMLAEDLILATKKYDLDKFITPSSYEDAAKMLDGGAQQMGPQPTFDRGGGFQAVAPVPGSPNPFEPSAAPVPSSAFAPAPQQQ